MRTILRLQITLAALALFIGGLSACAAPPSALDLAPVTGAGQGVQVDLRVREYALVEQSTDSPTHAGFAGRAPAAVAETRQGWLFAGSGQPVEGLNQALAPFGFHLAANPSPPFSSYALYSGERLLQRDIARFWPVSVKDGGPAGQGDFLLAFETLSGERMFASQAGIQPWTVDTRTQSSDGPVEEAAYAPIGGGVVSLMGIPALADQPVSQPVQGYDEIFYPRMIDGQPFFFFVKHGIVHLHHAGQDLPYTYDMVVHDNPDDLAMYNPGSAGGLVWFYALRDGLWYYVEVGV